METFSRKGLGTRQSVKIPLTSEEGGNERTAEQIDLSASPKGARILVVDDDEQVGQLCRDILESYQYECEVFTEPRKLLERIGEEPEVEALVAKHGAEVLQIRGEKTKQVKSDMLDKMRSTMAAPGDSQNYAGEGDGSIVSEAHV